MYVCMLLGGEPKAFSIVFAIWEPFMAQSQDRVDGRMQHFGQNKENFRKLSQTTNGTLFL